MKHHLEANCKKHWSSGGHGPNWTTGLVRAGPHWTSGLVRASPHWTIFLVGPALTGTIVLSLSLSLSSLTYHLKLREVRKWVACAVMREHLSNRIFPSLSYSSIKTDPQDLSKQSHTYRRIANDQSEITEKTHLQVGVKTILSLVQITFYQNIRISGRNQQATLILHTTYIHTERERERERERGQLSQ